MFAAGILCPWLLFLDSSSSDALTCSLLLQYLNIMKHPSNDSLLNKIYFKKWCGQFYYCLMCLWSYYFWDSGSCSPRGLWTCCIEKNDLRFLFFLPPPPKFWDYRYVPPCLCLLFSAHWIAASIVMSWPPISLYRTNVFVCMGVALFLSFHPILFPLWLLWSKVYCLTDLAKPCFPSLAFQILLS